MIPAEEGSSPSPLSTIHEKEVRLTANTSTEPYIVIRGKPKPPPPPTAREDALNTPTLKPTPVFPERGCGFKVTYWGAINDTPGMAWMPAPIEITDTVTDVPVVSVLTVVEAREIAFDLLDAALHAEDAATARQQQEIQQYAALGLPHPGFSVKV